MSREQAASYLFSPWAISGVPVPPWASPGKLSEIVSYSYSSMLNWCCHILLPFFLSLFSMDLVFVRAWGVAGPFRPSFPTPLETWGVWQSRGSREGCEKVQLAQDEHNIVCCCSVQRCHLWTPSVRTKVTKGHITHIETLDWNTHSHFILKASYHSVFTKLFLSFTRFFSQCFSGRESGTVGFNASPWLVGHSVFTLGLGNCEGLIWLSVSSSSAHTTL